MKTSIKGFFCALIALIFAFGVTACGLEDLETLMPNISFEKAEVELKVNETYELSPVISGVSGSDLVEYSFDKEGYLSLSGNTITALKVGSVVITASLKGYDLSANLTITIKEETQRVLANIPEILRGTYSNNGISVVVEESKVTVRGDGEAIEFNVYTEDDSMYIMDEVDGVTIKIFITFNESEKTVTADGKGTFSKDEGTTPITTDTLAKIPVKYQNAYLKSNYRLLVYENKITVEFIKEEKREDYTVYEDKNGYFVYFDEEKVYITIDEEKVVLKGDVYFNEGQFEKQATVPEDKCGTYVYADLPKIVVNQHTIVLSNGTYTADLYVDDDGTIYFYVPGSSGKVRHDLIFKDGYLINGNLQYSKEGSGNQEEHEEYNKANISADLQGKYTGTNAYITVSSNTAVVIDASGKTMTYDLFEDKEGIFFLEGTNKIYCKFEKNTVTNKYGTFKKETGEGGDPGTTTEEPVEANIPSSQQGQYKNENTIINVGKNSVVVMDATGRTMTYNLFEDKQGIYFLDNGEKVYCEFKENTVTNKYGTFTRSSADGGETGTTPDDGGSQGTNPTTYSLASLPQEQTGVYSSGRGRAEIGPNHIALTTTNGTTFSFELYQDESGVFFLENDAKHMLTFRGTSVSVEGYGVYEKEN